MTDDHASRPVDTLLARASLMHYFCTDRLVSHGTAAFDVTCLHMCENVVCISMSPVRGHLYPCESRIGRR